MGQEALWGRPVARAVRRARARRGAPDGWPWQLHEDMDLPALGFPRDLNGDGAIDGADHAGDYSILPVQVVVRWRAAGGDAEYRATTSLVGDP